MSAVPLPADAAPRLGRRGTFVPNILSNGLNFGISILIGFWFTPFLIGKLGVAVYGLIPLTATVTRYFGIITLALDQSVGRYLTIALKKADGIQANRAFNSAFFGTLLACALLLLPFAGLSLFADRVFNVPAGHETEIRFLFALTACAFLVEALRAPFRASAFALNRFDLQNAVEVAYNLARVTFVVVLFALMTPRLWQVGAAMLAAGALALLGAIGVWRYLTPVLEISRRHLDLATLGSIGRTSGWVLASSLGIILAFSVDLLVVNLLFGAEAGGRYAVVWQWSALLRGLAMTLSGVFAPSILANFAAGDTDALVTYARRAVKFVGLAMALPTGLICGLAVPLLRAWLGEAFTDLAPLFWLLLGHFALNLAFIPLSSVILAADAVRLPAIVNLSMGALNLALALALAGPAGWGLYGVAAAGAIVLTVRNLVFTPQYAARALGRGLGTFFANLFPIVAALGIVAGAAFLTARVFRPDGWIDLAIAAAAIGTLYAACTFFFLLKREERHLIHGMIDGVRLKIMPAKP